MGTYKAHTYVLCLQCPLSDESRDILLSDRTMLTLYCMRSPICRIGLASPSAIPSLLVIVLNRKVGDYISLFTSFVGNIIELQNDT